MPDTAERAAHPAHPAGDLHQHPQARACDAHSRRDRRSMRPARTSTSASATTAPAFRGDRAGRGLASMRQRAKIIGARLDIEPSAAGTTLHACCCRCPDAAGAITAKAASAAARASHVQGMRFHIRGISDCYRRSSTLGRAERPRIYFARGGFPMKGKARALRRIARRTCRPSEARGPTICGR